MCYKVLSEVRVCGCTIHSLRRLGSLFHPSPLPPVSTHQLLAFPPLRHWALGIRNYALPRNAVWRRGRTVGVRAISTPGWAFVQTKRTWLLTSFAHFRENGPQICSGLGKGQCQYCPPVEYRRHDRSALCLITMRVRHVLLTRHYSVWEKTREGDTETVCMAAYLRQKHIIVIIWT